VALAAAACGPIDQSGGSAAGGGAPDAGAGGASPAPIEVRIVAPPNGEKCKADGNGSCAISVAVSGATVAPPGRCAGAQRCGHIDLYVDGKACGSPNAQSGADDFTANFNRCGKAEGEHTLQVELRDDAGTLLAQSAVVRIEVEKEDQHGGGDGGHD
jgi:hypothetical protein